MGKLSEWQFGRREELSAGDLGGIEGKVTVVVGRGRERAWGGCPSLEDGFVGL